MLNNLINSLIEERKKQFAPIIPTEDVAKFMEIYDNFLTSDGNQSRRTEQDGFHPSHLGVKYGNCMRRAVYLLSGIEKASSFDSRTMRIFGNGHGVHNRIQQALEEIFGSNFEAEIEVAWDHPTEGTPIRGHADGLLILGWYEDGHLRRVIIEIKSCSQTVYENRLKFKKAKAEHFDQANIYAYVLECDSIWFIYENKNTQEYIVFDQPADKEKAEKQIAKWTKAWKIHKRGELPVRPYKMESEACSSCDMRDHCWSDPTEGVKLV